MNDQDELTTLLAMLAEGPLGESDSVRLSAMLRGDGAAVDAYVSSMLTAAMLGRELSRTRPAALMPAAAIEPAASEAATEPIRWRPTAYAAAAAVVIASALAAVYYGAATSRPVDTDTDGGRAIATVVDIESSDGAPMNPGDALVRGPLPLEHGSIDLLMGSGASVTLSGPGEFELIDPMSVRVSRGRAHCIVPPGAVGFTVVTPNGVRIVDMGTQFVVRVDQRGRSFVGVIEGLVRVHRGEIGAGINRPLGAGEAVVIDGGETRPALLVQGAIVVESIVVDPVIFNASSNRVEDGDDPPGLAGAFTHSALLPDEAIEEVFGKVYGGPEPANVMFADDGVADNGDGVIGSGDETVDFIEWRTDRPVTIGGYRVELATDGGEAGGARSARMMRLIVEGQTVDAVDAEGRHGELVRLLTDGPVTGRRFRVELTRGTAGPNATGPRLIEIDAVNATAATDPTTDPTPDEPPAAAPGEQESERPATTHTQGDSR